MWVCLISVDNYKFNLGIEKVLRIVPRDGWLAQLPLKPLLSLDLPVSKVIVSSTNTENCTTQSTCTYRVRILQTYNIEATHYDDIIYNFLIGGDGNVYEGRGWDNVGAHLKGWNDRSISLAFIGTFKKVEPNEKQISVSKLLLEEGVRLGKLTEDYKIYGAQKIVPNAGITAADALYESFKSWPQWSESPSTTTD
ncbi:peptidoglycan-recognition protein LC-like [Teleopsis dalmanni]|uniref:peptidoglycan-recognition protein LC-like n=1 Tax=Teleopsis dalmanni TaxID=139649 RepID=UPI0018CD8214|nr:peptidoglycan-recognition protein LC-like [Teleopsis dalmanni]